MIVFFPQAFQEKCVFEYRDYSPRTAFDNLKNVLFLLEKVISVSKMVSSTLWQRKHTILQRGEKRNPERFWSSSYTLLARKSGCLILGFQLLPGSPLPLQNLSEMFFFHLCCALFAKELWCPRTLKWRC